MLIQLNKAGKRFYKEWIFRNFSFEFQEGNAYALIGPNGSGKSTLLQCIASSMLLTEGSVQYKQNGIQVLPENCYAYLCFAAPYLELVEEMTAAELLNFHQKFKPFIYNIPVNEILQFMQLNAVAYKQIRYLSSGMKQRLKLAQAVFSDVPVILLDEPCTNFDAAGFHLYHSLIKQFANNRLIIVSSNDENEYNFCSTHISLLEYK